MGIETLHAGIELEIFATVLARLCEQPIQQFAAETAGAIMFARNQIVHIEELSRKKRFEKSVAGNGANLAVRFKECENVSLLPLKQDALDKLLRILKKRTQFAHDRLAAPDFFRRVGDRDARAFHCDDVDLVSRLPSYQMPRPSRERAARGPCSRTLNQLPKISRAEYIRSFRPDVRIGSARILKRPSFRNAMLK